MKNLKENHISALVIILLIVIWEFSVFVFKIPMYVLPSPIDVIDALIKNINEIFYHSLVTMGEAVLGLIVAFIIAVFIAIIMDKFSIIKKAIYPILVVTQTVPMIVLAPIFVIYLGFGLLPKIVTVVLMCFFPIVVSFSDGLYNVDKEYINLAKSYGANSFTIYKTVKIPAAIPSLFSGLKVAATYSISGAVVGEWVAAQEGLGYYLIRAKNAYMLDTAFACVFMVIILSLLMNLIIKIIIFIKNPYLNKII